MTRGYMTPAKSVEWETPQDFFDALDAEFSFTLDPCATLENAKCVKFYTKEDDGLSKSWANERVFMNPPYGYQIKKWTAKALMEVTNDFARAELIVGLLPARTDTAWFHDHVYGKAEIRFLRGRLKFGGAGKGIATFPSIIVIWKGIT